MRELQTQLPIQLPNGTYGIPLIRAELHMLPNGSKLLDKFGREFVKGYDIVTYVTANHANISQVYMKVEK